ncbi:polyphosphate kinase 1 [Spirochaeta cellobiosiphila]|uniref:polyphosphate kinase 1 n=1 Tax=Spirochaeta cellobiosiphila TaxID=504483 RepID=UPI000419B757|nr:polyphosphate kinase 1 [Spirochaeta cellobiosiphila]
MSNEYIPREISWVEFNKRVLYEGCREDIPLLERLKFLSIVSSNFDEFFMVRVASLKRQINEGGDRISCPSGTKPSTQLKLVEDMVRDIHRSQYKELNSIIHSLINHGLHYIPNDGLDGKQSAFIKELFRKELFSVLSPIRLDYKKNLPVIQNLGLNIAYLLKEEGKEELKLAILQIPSAQQRIIWLPDIHGESCFTLIEEVIASQSDVFFPGHQIIESTYFRLTRDADLEVDEEKGDDFVEAMEEILIDRLHSTPVRMEITNSSMDIEKQLMNLFDLTEDSVYRFDGPLNLKDFMALAFVPSFDALKYPEWKSVNELSQEEDIWSQIQAGDIVLHHPYDSFSPVIRMVREASVDPMVLSIKMTLYRTSGDSPIIKALKEAAMNGIQVIVLVELKARFDEARNILWARELERAGVIVIYGVAQLKVHSKAMMIIRRENEGIRRYVHMGTGNYNDKTAKLYTDLSLITCSDSLTYEIALFFNVITGYSSIPQFEHIWMSPDGIRERILDLIKVVIDNTTHENPGVILVKMNSLAHPQVIDALYKASQMGVQIKLNIRGICMLKPGVPGLSENIEVVSIVDRYLEHSRIFYFQYGGHEDLYLSSADWMPRNLEKRVEIMFPVLDSKLKIKIRKMLDIFFKDNTNAHRELPDGSYVKITDTESEPFRAQDYFNKEARQKRRLISEASKKNLKVRRKLPER